jgi:malonyl-CoA O-methyltransferase
VSTDGPDEFRVARSEVRAAFDRASARYDTAALVQQRVREELLARVGQFALEPAVVLDLGAGTGHATRALKGAYRRATVIALDIAPGMLRQAGRQSSVFRRFSRVCADAFRLPVRPQSVDLVFSSLMLQWCDPPDAVFAEVRRALRPDGLFAFATFGPDTLRELRAAWSAADGFTHVNRFTDMHDLGDALVRAGLTEPVLDVDRLTVTYADAHALMRDLKTLGAHNVTAGRARGLTGRGLLQRMLQAYEAFRREGSLPATWEVVYGAAWGAAGQPAESVHDGEVRVPLGAIRRRPRP